MTHPDDGLPGPDEVAYPSTLRITSLPAAQAQEASIERAERWEDGEEVPHVVNFQDRARLRQLLTDQRMELLEAVMDRPPESMRALAGRLERDVNDVRDDLDQLAEYNIVHFEEGDREEVPFVPYDTIRIEDEIRSSPPEEEVGGVPDPNEFDPESADIGERLRRRSRFSATLSQNGFPDTLVLSHESGRELFYERRMDILGYLEDDEPRTVGEIAEELGYDESAVRSDLDALANIEVVEHVEDGSERSAQLKHSHVVVEPVV